MNCSKMVPAAIEPVPSDRQRSREVLNEPDDPVGRARDGRKGDWTKPCLSGYYPHPQHVGCCQAPE